MSNIKNVLQMTSLLFAMALLFSYIAWLLGYEGFIIVGHIQMNWWITHLICSGLLLINLSLLMGFVLNIYSFKILYYSLPIVAISFISGIFWTSGELFTGLVPTVILIIVIFVRRKKDFGQYFYNIKVGKFFSFNVKVYILGYARIILITTITFIFQYIIAIISHLDLSTRISMYQMLRLSINSIILMILFYCIGGVYYVYRTERLSSGSEVRLLRSKRLELLVFPERIRDDEQRSESIPQVIDNIPITRFEQGLMMSSIAIVQILQWAFILWICSLDNLFLDALVMTTSFICHGMIIAKRKHLKPVILCTLAATAMFYFAARFTLSFQYSQFFPIIIGLLLVYTVYYISYCRTMESKNRAKEELARIERLEQQVAEAWEHLDNLM